ncbi:TetR family transcriptional regulator [Nonomuraea sp. M3C6]|uniref:TetR family transcriptional regulator n=1 Tax=Nonomuraea marmarensis TaxID=3351344 RepID=A0ABW7ABI4_9ACTN
MTSTLRRRPAQRRSVERVERMLDECALLLDEVGYEALTTKEVARRAEVPIGTFYQFFHDKQGLVRALARRNLEAFLRRVTERIAVADLGHWTDLVDLAIDEFVDMKRTTPGFAVMDFGEVLTMPGGPPVEGTKRALDGTQDNNSVVADRLRSVTLDLLDAPGGRELDCALLVAVEATDAVLKLAFRVDPCGDQVLIAECKRLVRLYLADHLPEPAAGCPPPATGRPYPA